MFKRTFFIVTLLLVSSPANWALAATQNSSNFSNEDTTLAPVNFNSNSANFQVAGSVESITGNAQSANFQTMSGIPLSQPSVTPAPTPTPTPTPSGGGGLPSTTPSYLPMPTLIYQPFTFNTWQKLTGTRDAATTHIWVNGSEDGVVYPTATTWERLLPLFVGVNDVVIQSVGLNNARSVQVGGQITRVLVGDVDRNGVINDFDLSQFTRAWRTYAAAADFNEDGKVDDADLSLLVSNWGQPVATPSTLAGSANLTFSGLKQVAPGQIFTVTVLANNLVDIDTLRLNGRYPSTVLELLSVVPAGSISRSSPGNKIDVQTGTFTFGAFNLGSPVSGQSKLVVLTFRARQVGTGTMSLERTSRVLSNGTDQIGSLGTFTVKVAGAAVNVPGAALTSGALSVTSNSNPDLQQWYPSNQVNVSWQTPGKNVLGVYVGFDQIPNGTATQKVSGTSESFTATAGGIWYVHLVARYADGTSDRVDYPVKIDRQAPNAFQPVVDQDLIPANLPNAVHFGTTDDVSGIAYYQVKIDGRPSVTTTATSIPLQNLSVGTHQIKVEAVDQAGNRMSGQVSFTVIGAVHGWALFKTMVTHLTLTDMLWILAGVEILIGGGWFIRRLWITRRKSRA